MRVTEGAVTPASTNDDGADRVGVRSRILMVRESSQCDAVVDEPGEFPHPAPDIRSDSGWGYPYVGCWGHPGGESSQSSWRP